MRPDSHVALRETIELGPDKLRPEMFQGELPAILAGLRAHANTISHARHVAMEETFPRTRALLETEVFHAIAGEHLAAPQNVRRPHAQIGEGFWTRLNGAARDLALLEWAWLLSHGAADAEPFDLQAIAGMDAEAIAMTPVGIHPATRLVPLATSGPIEWDGDRLGGAAILVTRPRSEVMLAGVNNPAIAMIEEMGSTTIVADLLEKDSETATMLITAGAFAFDREILL